MIFSRQLATMIDSGITLIAALEILKEQADNKNLARIISYIYMDVEGGKSFCDAVAKYPQAFSDFYINMIKAGEASGMLDEVLERLALYLEKTASAPQGHLQPDLSGGNHYYGRLDNYGFND